MSAIKYKTTNIRVFKNRKDKKISIVLELDVIETIKFPDELWDNIKGYLFRDADEYMVLKHLHLSSISHLNTILKHYVSNKTITNHNKIVKQTELSIQYRKSQTIKLIIKHLKTDYLTLYNDYFSPHIKLQEIEWLKDYQIGEEILLLTYNNYFNYTHTKSNTLTYAGEIIRKAIILKKNFKSLKIGVYKYTSEHYTETIFINNSVRILNYYRLNWEKDFEEIIVINSDRKLIKYNDSRYCNDGRFYYNNRFIVGKLS